MLSKSKRSCRRRETLRIGEKMSAPITNLQAAQRDAIMNRPAVNGFPIWPRRCAAPVSNQYLVATGDAKPVRD